MTAVIRGEFLIPVASLVERYEFLKAWVWCALDIKWQKWVAPVLLFHTGNPHSCFNLKKVWTFIKMYFLFLGISPWETNTVKKSIMNYENAIYGIENFVFKGCQMFPDHI